MIHQNFMKKYTIAIVVVVLAILGFIFFRPKTSEAPSVKNDVVTKDETGKVDTNVNKNPSETVIGKSVGGRDIKAYHFGNGSTELLFIGGIHGGYEWNTVLVAQKLVDSLKKDPTLVPENLKVTVIPVLNPDGLYKVVGKDTGDFTKADVAKSATVVESGRFNGNNVDLNRNFDCDWQAQGKWQTKTVSGGSKTFSEPEAEAIKNYVESKDDKNVIGGVVVWYSAAGGVFSSNCHNGVSDETKKLTGEFAVASGYPAYESFNFYEITGDMVNWFAKKNVPAISVLLTNHEDIEWDKNFAGYKAVVNHFKDYLPK